MEWIPRRLGPGLLAALILLVLATALVGFGWRRCLAPTTVFIVRHADRAGHDDALTPAGELRAAALAHVFAKQKLAAIYHSDTRRTRDTAAPLAQVLGLVPRERPARAVDALVGEVLAEHRGERTLVVAHGNTSVQIIQAAGGPSLPNLAEDEFDDLFVLEICGCFGSRVNLMQLQYGVPSP